MNEKTIKVNNLEKKIKYTVTECISSELTFGDEEGTREIWFYPEIRKGDVFVDIGAAYGSYSIPALVLGAHVIAFTPKEDEDQYQTIIDNLKLNCSSEQNFCVYGHGLYDKTGYLRTLSQMFYETRAEAELDFHPNTPNDVVINVIPLDEFNIEKIDIMKLDVEGAELHILKGARKTIEKCLPRLILVENHTFKDKDIGDKVIEFIDSLQLGYTNDTGTGENVTRTRFARKIT